ncbi:probable glutamate receptor [Palaemon carinicauda]|uniref:probable glutamate receptor n=1 Tax=Palaemon carinicauda TaxID=392227 RepID=UPI0035B57B43
MCEVPKLLMKVIFLCLMIDLTASLGLSFQKWTEVTLFSCDGALKQLQKLLTGFNQLESPRFIVVLCSFAKTLDIFQKIRDENLESAVTWWLVVLQTDTSCDIVAKLREGTKVTFAIADKNITDKYFYLMKTSYINVKNLIRDENLESAVTWWLVVLQTDTSCDIVAKLREGTKVTFAIVDKNVTDKYIYLMKTSYINVNNLVALQDIGWWAWSRISGVQSTLKTSLYRPIKDAYWDFGGRRLKATVIDNWPFWVLKYSDDESVEPVSGIDYNVLSTLGKKLNFTFEVSLTPDKQWGGVLKDGRVTGMVGAVHRYDVHLAINELTITGKTAPRDKAVDFTNPYFLESTTIISPSPSKILSPQSVLEPFRGEVWFLIALVTLLMGPTVKLFVWMRKYLLNENIEKNLSLSDLTYSMFKPIVMQGCMIHPLTWCLRSIFVSWFVFTTYVYALYSGSLISVLSVPSYEKPIDSLQDLLDAIRHRGTQMLTVCGSNNEFLFSMTTQQIYIDIWELFDYSTGCVKTWDEGVDKVITGKYAYINNRMGGQVRANLRGKRRFHFAKNEFNAHGYAIACPSGSPYREVFADVLIWLMSTGLIQKFSNDELMKAQKPETISSESPEPFTLLQLQAGFYLLVTGWMTATGMAVVETLFHKIAHKK